MLFELPKLDYEYDALEPTIDSKTMEIHHTKHHMAYITNLSKALEGQSFDMPLEEMLTKLNELPEEIRTTVRNNGGGHYNHTMFWKAMSPTGGGTPKGALETAINESFESFEQFKEVFSKAALTRFGSGWAWLVVNEEKKLEVLSTPNQDNPIMENSKLFPILGVDVWEHAYYLNYQNKRAEYIEKWWNVVNWDHVEELFEETTR